MNRKWLNVHIGYRSSITLYAGEKALCCCPGDLHALTLRNVHLAAELLSCGAISTTGQIKRTGHPLESQVIVIQNLPALKLEPGTLTSVDVRNIQAAKAKAASQIEALLRKAGISSDAPICVHIHSLDGRIGITDAKRIGLLLPTMQAEDGPEMEEWLEAEICDFSTDVETIRGYTEHMFFP